MSMAPWSNEDPRLTYDDGCIQLVVCDRRDGSVWQATVETHHGWSVGGDTPDRWIGESTPWPDYWVWVRHPGIEEKKEAR